MSVPYECMEWLGREEEDDLAAVRGILKPGQTFVGCGANIGVWTLQGAMIVGAQGKVHAFEPNPATFEKLQHNIRLNALEGKVRASCVACGDREGGMPLVCNEEHNTSRVTADAVEKAVMVPMTTLDRALAEIPVHGIKIDVEGYEMHVLKGAREILLRSKPWLCIEFNTLMTGSNRLGDWDVHQYLLSLGYSCCRMAEAADASATNARPDDWETKGYCNLFYFVP
jgi:FkbM family methyltransferase